MLLNNLIRYLVKNGRISFSQSGEDMICGSWLNKPSGFYIDIGSNHPIRLNNTYFFYQKGWSGINVEPNQNLLNISKKLRRRDNNLLMGVSKESGTFPFFSFKPHTLSTFSRRQRDLYIKAGYKQVAEIQVKCLTLSELFTKYVKKNEVDILNIDVEGCDKEVVMGNDWRKYRPNLVIVETAQHKPLVKESAKFDKFFKLNKYYKFADTFLNSIYASSEFITKNSISYTT